MKFFILAWGNKKNKEGGWATAEIYAEALDKGAALALEYKNCVVYELKEDGTSIGLIKWTDGIDNKGNLAMPYDGTAIAKLWEGMESE